MKNKKMREISLNGRAPRTQNQNSKTTTIVKAIRTIRIVKEGRQIKSGEGVARLARHLAMVRTGTMGNLTRIPTRT